MTCLRGNLEKYAYGREEPTSGAEAQQGIGELGGTTEAVPFPSVIPRWRSLTAYGTPCPSRPASGHVTLHLVR
jgi:hypothetical protein